MQDEDADTWAYIDPGRLGLATLLQTLSIHTLLHAILARKYSPGGSSETPIMVDWCQEVT